MSISDYIVSEFLEAGVALAKTVLKGGAEATGKGLLKTTSQLIKPQTGKGAAKFVSPRIAASKGLQGGQTVAGA